ncbi:hypothetical protein KUTeg_013746 [Tegillarca granosa]|uniref:Sulfatase N-terminal domain-containing protein n=1 Tax=Tegillarca granosa TaxID=220873 RepID=A0ABQ9EUL1_TEGGR|nr:hypothetical protein KUTeg_013746 [Tegillarca granosa]
MTKQNIELFKILAAWFFIFQKISVTLSAKPNIVLLIADDLGYGDVGIFGNTTLPTPNIDKLISQGAKLTHHLAASSVCSPSRSALMTGRYPIRSGTAPTGEMRMNLFIANRCGLPPNETTIAEIAKTQNYKTALDREVASWIE